MNTKLILAETELEQWHKLIREAEADYGYALDESMQSYLVFTLMRFMKEQALNTHALALDYLEAHCLPEKMKLDQLRNIGDQCLLISGLFPKRAQKNNVRISYYVDLGRSAYHHLSHCTQRSMAELYSRLAATFIQLMDLLQTIRHYSAPALQPIAALELWSDTGSQFAYKLHPANALPLHESLINRRLKQ